MPRLPLNTHEAARQSLARLMREFRNAEKAKRDVAGFRALVYAFSVLLSFFKLESDLAIEERLERIETELRRIEDETAK